MLEINPLQVHDNERYRSLWVFALTEQSDFFRTSIEDDPCPSIPTRFTADSFTLGAFNGSDLIGILSLERDPKAKLRHKALLFRMFVHPSASGQGVGKSLLEQTLSRADAVRDLNQLYLTVLATNLRARKLYESFGFEEFAYERNAVRIGSQYVDEMQMIRYS